MKIINKIKHLWYTYVRNKPEMSPLYYTKSEITRRVLKKFDIKPDKIYNLMGNIPMYFSVAIDVLCGDVSFIMCNSENIPTDVEKSFVIDAHNFLHIQCDGEKYRQHIWNVPHKYFKDDGEHSAKFDTYMMRSIFEYLVKTIEEIKEN